MTPPDHPEDAPYCGHYRTAIAVLQRLALEDHAPPATPEASVARLDRARSKKLASLLAMTMECLDRLLVELDREASDSLRPTATQSHLLDPDSAWEPRQQSTAETDAG